MPDTIMVYDMSNMKSRQNLKTWMLDFCIAELTAPQGIVDNRGGGVVHSESSADSRLVGKSIPAIAASLAAPRIESTKNVLLQKIPILVVGNKRDLVTAEIARKLEKRPLPNCLKHGPVLSSWNTSDRGKLDLWLLEVYERHFSFGQL